MGFALYAQIPYTENFDAFPVDNATFGPGAEPFPFINGWVNVQAGDDAQDWYGRSVATGSSNTGPTQDHTSGSGTYVFVEDGFGSFTNIALESPMIDLSGQSGVELSYWAHSQTTSASGNSMVVEAWDGTTWTQVDSFGILSTTNTWFNRLVNLSPFAGDSVKIRWRGANNVTAFQHDIAIDDVEIYPTTLTATVPMITNASCAGSNDGSLTAMAVFGTPPYTYLWTTGDTSQTITAGAGTYCVVITDSLGDTSSTCATINQPPPITYSFSTLNQTVCFGDMNAEISIDSAAGGQPVNACGLASAAAQCNGPEDTLQIGFDSTFNANTIYPAPFGNWYWGARQQVLFRADELVAAGVEPGLIKGMAWDVFAITGGGTNTYVDYEIRMGCTPDSVLSPMWIPVPDVVWPADTVVIDSGWNWFQFAQPYIWDGVQNIVIEFCFNNSGFTRNAESPFTPTSYPSCHFYRADNSTVCGNNANTGTSNNRPNIRLANCEVPVIPYNVLWTPTGDTVPAISGLGAGTYGFTITDGNGCTVSDSAVIDEAVPAELDDEEVCDGDDTDLDPGTFVTYMWSTGDTTPTINVPSTAGGYAVTVTDQFGCVSVDTAVITTLANPTPSIGPDVEVCADATPVSLDAGAGFDEYDWSTGDTTQMTSVSMSGMYDVIVTDTNGCEGEDSVMVTVNPNPSVSLGNDTTVCQFDLPLTLSAPAGLTYTWQDGSMNQTFDIDTTAQGQGPLTYSVMVMDSNGCTGSDSVVVTVDICPGIIGANPLLTQVYPNPTQQFLNVKVFDVTPGALNVRVVDLNGRVVYDQRDDNHNGNVVLQLDLGQLAQGMYYLHIENDDRNSVHRITIQ